MARGPQWGTSIGIDLSASAVNTAAVELSWDGDRAAIVQVWGEGRQRVGDDCVRQLLERSDAKIGVDCPFGWPKNFVALMAAQAEDVTFGLADRKDTRLSTPAEREALVLRETDRWVIESTRATLGRAVRPLSVSADLIAHVALRFAGLRTQMTANEDAPRDGSGPLVEVYPAAALALWNATWRQYKGAGEGRCETRAEIVADLCVGIDGVMSACTNIDEFRDVLVASDHVLDAFVCALIARDSDVRGVHVPEAHRPAALREGWIHLPEQRPRTASA